MRILVTVSIILLLALPTSASFFDEFRGSVSSVHTSVGRLFGNACTHVSDTIGCTILAVKQALSFDGSFPESTEYTTRCKGKIPPAKPSDQANRNPINYLDDHDAEKEIEDIEAQLKRQTDRLWEISALLRRELDNFPTDLKIQFGVRDPDPSESVLSCIWRDLKTLHEIEHHTNQNDAQANEIHEVLDKALEIMKINETSPNETDDEKIKSIVLGLEKESNDTITEVEGELTQWEKEEEKERNETKAKIENDSLLAASESSSSSSSSSSSVVVLPPKQKQEGELTQWEKEEEKERKETKAKIENDISLLAASVSSSSSSSSSVVILPPKRKQKIVIIPKLHSEQIVIPAPTKEKAEELILEIKDILQDSSENKPIEAVTVTPTTSTTTSAPLDPDFEAFQAFVLAQMEPQDDKSAGEAVDSAKKLISDSKTRNTIFKYLKNTDDNQPIVFDNPELFNF